MNKQKSNIGTWLFDHLDILSAALVGIILYGNTLSFKLVWDDLHLVAYVNDIYKTKGVWGLISSEFILNGATGYFRPVVLFSFWLDKLASHILPCSAHLTNLTLHIINICLVLSIFKKVLRSSKVALIGTLLFAVHPVNVEAVAFGSGRTDLLACAFVLLTLIFWNKASGAESKKGFLFFCALSAFTFLLGGLSKEAAWMLPIIAAGWTVVGINAPSNRTTSKIFIWTPILCWAVLIVAILAFRLMAGIGFGAHANSLNFSSVLPRLTIYFRLLVFPWPLNAYYSASRLNLTVPDVAGAILLILAAIIFLSRKHRRIGLPAIIWIAGFILPVSGIVSLRTAALAERFLYLPSIGIALLGGYAVELLSGRAQKHKSIVYIIFSILIIIFSLGSFSRSWIWKNEISLFSDIAQTSPDLALGYYNLGGAYEKEGNYSKAIEAYQSAIDIDSKHADAYFGMAVALFKIGQVDKAIAAQKEALSISPDNPEYLENLANYYMTLKRWKDAAPVLAKAIKLNPGNVSQYRLQGDLFSSTGNYEQSVVSYNKALEINPLDSLTLQKLGIAYTLSGLYEKAIAVFKQDIKNNQQSAIAHYNLGWSYMAAGQLEAASKSFIKALSLNPDYAKAAFNAGVAFMKLGDLKQAIKMFNKTIEIDQNNSLAYFNLAAIYLELGDRNSAIVQLRALSELDEKLAAELTELMGE